MDSESHRRHLPRHPNFYRRAEWHDYCSRCFYMVTFNTAEETPALSSVKGIDRNGAVEAWAQPGPVGKFVHAAINEVNRKLPIVEVSHPVIMPDHLHCIVFVKEKSELHLGDVVRLLKKECTARFHSAFPESALAIGNGSLFVEGYNDRIVYRTGQLAAFKKYIADNPRRHYLRVNYPQYFNKAVNIRIDGEIYSVYGNFMLLRHPEKSCVRISRRFTKEELERRQAEWEEIIRGCGVLVSPFISPSEKKIRDEAIEKGASIIRIVENGFPERYKPQGKEFDLCAAGRLLLIAPLEFNSRTEKIKREQCLAMNNLAEKIALAQGSMSLIHG